MDEIVIDRNLNFEDGGKRERQAEIGNGNTVPTVKNPYYIQKLLPIRLQSL